MKALKKIAVILLVMDFSIGMAQDDKVKFNATSRTFQQNSKQSQEDSLNANSYSNGYTLMDLGVNINPDRKTEIQAILRFKTDFGGFFGDGTEIDLRQLRVKGVFMKTVGYEIGDLFLKMSPFTLYNNAPEGEVNEATIFSDLRRDVAHYENFNKGNYWWQQGAHVDFGLEFEKLVHQVKVDAFFLRNRGTDFVSVPNSFYAGGKVLVKQSKNLQATFNFLNMYDDGASVGTNESTRNPVASLEIAHQLLFESIDIKSNAEIGMSKLVFVAPTDSSALVEFNAPDDYQDVFVDLGAVVSHKPSGVEFGLGYRYVGPDFFSAGAQSKRVNFGANPDVFTSINNNPYSPRAISLFDLTRDASLLNPVISRQLMTYDPRLSNAMPYGVATPNRQGINYGVAYTGLDEAIKISMKGALMSDVVGEGSTEKRRFMLTRIGADVKVNELIDWKKKMVMKIGTQLESTSRDDSLGVDLKSSLVDFGFDVEVFKQFDLLFGAKLLSSKGNEFLFSRNSYNELGNEVRFDVDQKESLYGFGFKYRFNEKIYLTVQDQIFKFNDRSVIEGQADTEWGFNQVLLLFNMKL